MSGESPATSPWAQRKLCDSSLSTGRHKGAALITGGALRGRKRGPQVSALRWDSRRGQQDRKRHDDWEGTAGCPFTQRCVLCAQRPKTLEAQLKQDHHPSVRAQTSHRQVGGNEWGPTAPKPQNCQGRASETDAGARSPSSQPEGQVGLWRPHPVGPQAQRSACGPAAPMEVARLGCWVRAGPGLGGPRLTPRLL